MSLSAVAALNSPTTAGAALGLVQAQARGRGATSRAISACGCTEIVERGSDYERCSLRDRLLVSGAREARLRPRSRCTRNRACWRSRSPTARAFRLPYEFLRVYSPSAEVRGHGPGQEVLQVGKRASRDPHARAGRLLRGAAGVLRRPRHRHLFLGIPLRAGREPGQAVGGVPGEAGTGRARAATDATRHRFRLPAASPKAEKAARVRRGLRPGRRALRPDERPDVARPAPRCGRRSRCRSRGRARASACSTSPRGSGDLARAFGKRVAPHGEVWLTDINRRMLARGRDRHARRGPARARGAMRRREAAVPGRATSTASRSPSACAT